MAGTRKPKVKFKVGDLVTGKDRSYRRSIYKFLSSTESANIGLFEFQSLRSDVVERWKDRGAPSHLYRMNREYSEFRKATPGEVLESDKARAMYYMLKVLRHLSLY